MMNTPADRIRALVDRVHGGSVNAAAIDIGMPQSSLAKILSGDVESPRGTTLQTIARFYEAKVGWLLAGEGTAPSVLTTVVPESVPDREYLRWRLMVHALHPSPRLRIALCLLPDAIYDASTRDPDPAVQGSTKVRNRLTATFRESQRLEYAAWIQWLSLYRALHGTETAVGLLENSVDAVERRFVGKIPKPTKDKSGWE